MLLWKYAFELRESKTKYVLEGMEAVLRLVLCPPLPSCPGRNSHSSASLMRGSVTVESSLPHKDVHFPSAVWPAQALSGLSQDSCGPAVRAELILGVRYAGICEVRPRALVP